MNRRMYPRLMLWPVLLGLVLLVGPAWGQAVIYVDAGASGAGDGSSWADAFTSVQAGLDAAGAGDQVWVAAGRYVENITLVDGVALYGGFAGDEDPAAFDLAERDFAVNETILDGNQAGSVVTATDLTHDETRIDGFTITNGLSGYGGGLGLWYSSPIIANNVITGNNATISGGGLYLRYSSAMIVGNTIRGNSGVVGGGGLHSVDSSPMITNNRIAANSVERVGGGLRLDTSSATIANNTITDNTARSSTFGYGGGLYLYKSSGTIVSNTITGNGEGGGLHLYFSSPTVANTIIAFNSSGVCQWGGTPTLRHNCAYGNDEYDYSGLDDLTGTDGNISEDPLFADRAYGNWHIQPDSPCVDAGDNDFVFGEFDMDGEPRIQPEGGTVDIGADESDGTVWPAGPSVIVRVSTDGDDENDGSSWSLAKRTVQAAIDVASRFGGEVWVAEGSYYERITLTPYAYVYGGFAGTEAERDQRDWVSNVTVLDGEQGGSVVTARLGHGVSALDGFTVTNGHADCGGGVFLEESSPTISNNTITGNSARSGGGLYMSSSSPTIANNTIASNSARHGGGLCVHYSSAPTIANNTITGNSADWDGGGLYLSSSSPTITNTIIAFNTSGVYLHYGDLPVLKHNCVYGNAEYDYCGMDDPTGTDGNISEDPLFVLTPGPGLDGEWGTEDDELGDLRLSAGSPYIDAGDNAYVPEFVTTDLDGNPRFVDGSGDGVATVDMGAYEYRFRPGDLNCDGVVNSFDIDPFVLALTSAIDEPPFAGYLAAYPDCDPRLADVNGDGLVNVFDIDSFVAALTGGVGK